MIAVWGLFGAGGLLLWAAVTGRSPAAVLRAILTAQPVPAAVPAGSTKYATQFASAPSSAPQNVQSFGSSVGIAAVSFARQQIGDDYLWGGNGPDRWDCSGLSMMAYRAAGKTIPRTAAAQAAMSQRVSSPAIGDLVFLGTPAYHVGLYVGDGQYVNAPYRGAKVRIDRVPRNAYYGRVA